MVKDVNGEDVQLNTSNWAGEKFICGGGAAQANFLDAGAPSKRAPVTAAQEAPEV